MRHHRQRAIAGIPSGGGGPTPLPSLVAHYPLTTDASDIAGTADGTILGTPTFSSEGVTVNGVDQGILVPLPQLSFGTIICDVNSTSSSWVMMCNTWSDANIASNFYFATAHTTSSLADECLSFVAATGSAINQFKQRNYYRESHSAFHDGITRRMAMTMDESGAVRFFADGVELPIAPSPKVNYDGYFLKVNEPAQMSIGCRKVWVNSLAYENYSQGTIRNMKIFNEVLTPEQVAEQ